MREAQKKSYTHTNDDNNGKHVLFAIRCLGGHGVCDRYFCDTIHGGYTHTHIYVYKLTVVDVDAVICEYKIKSDNRALLRLNGVNVHTHRRPYKLEEYAIFI